MHFLHILVFMITHASVIEGYMIFSMKDLNSCSRPVEIKLSSTGQDSTGILVYDLDSSYEPGLHCEVILRPPLAFGIVASIRSINLQPSVINYADCENYIQISKIGHHESSTNRICGYSDDIYEFQSYIYWGRTSVVFHTSNSSKATEAAFRLTFTAIRKGNNWCFEGERRCHNGHCIWKGLACDGHNNCGDVSDELDKFTAQCGNLSTGESLAVILVTIVGSLILLIVAAYFRGPKISRQIERLSALRSNEGVAAESINNESRNSGVATISRGNRYGSTAGLLSSEVYQTAANDPPPSYEEVLGLAANSIRRPISIERPAANGNISSIERPFTSRSISSVERPITRGINSSIERPSTRRTRRNTISVEHSRSSMHRNTVLNERPVGSIFRTQSFQS